MLNNAVRRRCAHDGEDPASSPRTARSARVIAYPLMSRTSTSPIFPQNTHDWMNVSTSESGARKYIPNVTTVTFQDPPALFLSLQQGKVEGVVLSELTLVKWKKDAEKSPVPIDILEPELFAEPWGIGMRKGETALINKVNDVLSGMEKSGESAKIFDKYLGAGTTYNLHRTFKIEPIKG